MHKQNEFKKLLSGSFISQTGSHFLTLALAAYVFLHSGSAVLSALVFVLSFLPSILVSAGLGEWVDQNISRKVLVGNEVLAILTSILCGLCISLSLPIWILCLILSLRSILMFVSRAGLTKWIKVITPPENQTTRIKLFFLGFFLSTALSGILTALVLSHGSIVTVIIVDVATYLISMMIILSLKPLTLVPIAKIDEQIVSSDLTTTLRSIFRTSSIKVSFLIVCLTQALFQGAYSVLVSFLPVRQFDLGIKGVGYFQLAASIGIIIGFLVNWWFPKLLDEKRSEAPARAGLLGTVGVVSLLVVALSSNLNVVLLFFFLMNCSYECIWLHHNSEFFRASPKNYAARYQFTLASSAAFTMSLITLAYSFAVQYGDLFLGVSLVAGVVIVIATILLFLGREKVAVPVPLRLED